MILSNYFNFFWRISTVVILASNSLFATELSKIEALNHLVEVSICNTEDLASVLETQEIANTVNENQPLVDVENLDKFPAKDHLTFSRLENPWQAVKRDADGKIILDANGNPTYIGPVNANHDLVTVRIINKGIEPLTINNLAISNTNYFKIEAVSGAVTSLSFPITLNTRQFIDVTIKFIAVNPGAWKWIKVLHETLTISSNDPLQPAKLVYLHGLWQLRGEDKYEPTAQDIIDAFGFKTRTGFAMSDPDKGNPTKLKGDEVYSPYFKRADPNKPVYVRQLGAYHGCCNSTEVLRYNIKGTTERTNIVSHRKEDSQSLLPRIINSTNPAEKSFVPHVEVFGFNVNNDYTDPALNVHPEYPNSTNKIGIRVWKVLDAQGKVVPNAFLIANDYLGSAWTNFDYNDNMYFISNVKPEIGTAYYSELSPTPSSWDFGNTETGSTHNKTIELKSLGNTYDNGTSDPAVTISKVEIVGVNKSEFTVSAPASTSINPQGTTSLSVQFKPTTSGFKIADLLVHYNMSESPLRIPLYAIATDNCKEITEQIKIKSGSDASVSANGKTWVSDKEYRKGNIRLDVPPAHVNSIAGTDEDQLYINYLSSNADLDIIRYEIPLSNGDYMIRLHFSENYWSKPGERVFTVKMENEVKMANFDILKEVGTRTALIKNIPVTVGDEMLNIEFTPTINRLSIAAVEIYKVNDGAGVALTTKITNATCNQNNGVIDASAGDSQQISYKLGADGVYQSSGKFENLAPGSYTVFAKAGSENCEASVPVVVEGVECPNSPPIVNSSINDQAAKEGSLFNFTFAANTFNDPDQGDVLVYSASLADGATLPSWLTFNPSSRNFNGTPGSEDVGSIEIKITATDSKGESVSDFFILAVSSKNDPFIGEIEDMVTLQDVAIEPVAFTISAGDYNMNDLELVADSDNEALIPNAKITFGGSGTERTVTITPASGKIGIANITVTLKANNVEASRTFKVTVLKDNDFPTISSIDNVNILVNTSTAPIAFIVADEDNQENELLITGISNNQELIPDGNIIFGGTGTDRTVTVTPAADKKGTATITIRVTDGESMAETSFNVIVSPVTSINEKPENKIKLYPNPAQNNITVHFENSVTGTTYLSVLDTRGKVHGAYTFEKDSSTKNYEVDLGKLSSGTYIIKIQQKDTVTFKKFIKN